MILKLLRRHKPFTLLEVIIAMGLTTLLLGILFRYYHQVSVANLKTQQVRQKIFSLSLFQEKLGQIFSQLSSGEENVSFCTREIRESVQSALLFKYNNGVDPDPSFCDELDGMLYLDKNKLLSLVIWSKGGNPRKEILLENVAKTSFRFFDTSDNSWQDVWSKENDNLPTLIELSIFFADKKSSAPPWQCIFFAARDDNPILYRSKDLLHGLKKAEP
ncbi:MAG TPA: DUF1494 domain-containing protein [Rhabdochlamydiaceae bacterium]|nr:DUF1494 domain-containing protein [Rhabdochlamydiaceae bacterium]